MAWCVGGCHARFEEGEEPPPPENLSLTVEKQAFCTETKALSGNAVCSVNELLNGGICCEGERGGELSEEDDKMCVSHFFPTSRGSASTPHRGLPLS